MKVIAKERVRVLLYENNASKPTGRVDFDEKDRIGNVHFLDDAAIPAHVPYRLEVDGELVTDPEAVRISSAREFGSYDRRKVYSLRYPMKPVHKTYVPHPVRDLIVYQAHVRGFTRSESCRTKQGGTFRAMEENIPYLKNLGITALELMPVYDFDETGATREITNYWGYAKGNYYAPKPSYAAGDDEIAELRSLIEALHKNGIDVILQMYMPEKTAGEIIDILVHWIRFYGVDGFHILAAGCNLQEVFSSPYLVGTKLFSATLREDNCCTLQDDESFLADVRRFLRGEDNAAQNMLYYLTQAARRVNFPAYHNGLTLRDTFSYEKKHNEENGESNQDGTNYNFSMNFGQEGDTDDPSINAQRIRAVKNALLLTFFSVGIPKIYMGDEVYHTLKGNNNAYRLDTEKAYLPWNPDPVQKELLDFVKELIQVRKTWFLNNQFPAHDRNRDSMPDVSVHQEDAWQATVLPQNKHFAVFYAAKTPMLLTVNLSGSEERIGLPYQIAGSPEFIIGTTGGENPVQDGPHIHLKPHTVAVYKMKGGTKNVR